MTETMIHLSGVSRSFGSVKALDQIHLEVRRGEVMGFLGPNGAGKTTTMRILAGLLAPTEGSVAVAGVDVLDHPVEARARIGFLPENPPIYGEMTVYEYLGYLATLRRVPGVGLKQAVERAMERCGLTSVRDRLLRNLSKGFKQRAGIAQAIVHSPDVVILDEPTVGLDPIQIREIRALIRELGGEHSVLLSTHILPEVRMTCQRVAVIHQGRIVADDTLDALESRAHGSTMYYLRWRQPPVIETLRQIPGVGSVTPKEEGWLIRAESPDDPLPELVRLSAAEGWDLRELTQAGGSLEEIFLQLTTREERPDENEESKA
ncbi:MAG: ABC transporter ATP-binding protein [Magnetococcales bacterium]|nr:ABC transporter ATP-binding protein [Magnetococcales bacterium]NGZ06724.1 ABC transporter ATP-binding protein [Magnetococcales bacterium]